jgi:hypothetical protein
VRKKEKSDNVLLSFLMAPFSYFSFSPAFVTAKKLIALEERRQHQRESETKAQLRTA